MPTPIRQEPARNSAAPWPASRQCASKVVKSGTSPARTRRRSSPRLAFRVEIARQAQPQDLRQVEIEPHGRAQDFHFRQRQQAEPPGFVQHAGGGRIQNVGLLGGMHQLQILRDEFDIDQTAGRELQVPAVAVAFFCGYGAPHLDHIPAMGAASRLRPSAVRITSATGASNSGDDAEGCAHASTPCAPRSRLPAPDSFRTVDCVASGPERPDGRSRISTGYSTP